jgi:drug/metabolite transporter (DMT)-like permease
MVAMFIGLCAAFLGNYVAAFIVNGSSIPVLTAIVSALVMAVFEYLIKKKDHKVLESFSLALSMIIAMIATVFFSLVL